MTFRILALLLPVFLAVHTLEEFSRYEAFVRQTPLRLPRRFITRAVMRNAAILLTLAVAVLGVLTCLRPSPLYIAIACIAILGLACNAAGHCILSIRRRAWVPGTVSAVVLVLPYSLIAIGTMRVVLGLSWVIVLCYAVLGAIAAPLAILLCTGIGLAIAQRRETR